MGHLGPERGWNEVFCHFRVLNASVSADFAYYDWEHQYLVPNGGQKAERKFAGPKMGHLGPKRGQNEVLGHFLVQNWLVFADFANYCWK